MPDSGDSLVEVLLEFLEALVHQILFVRELYSPQLFERQRLYGIAVRRSRHPELNSYISDAISGLKPALASGSLHKFAVVVLGPGRDPVERFVFEPRITAPGGGSTAQDNLDVEAIEAQLRGILLKLQYADSYLSRLPPDCTFEVVAYSTWREGMPRESWVEEQPGPGHLELHKAEIVPIKTCTLENTFQLQLYAESG